MSIRVPIAFEKELDLYADANRAFVDVTRFGAKGDGITDDTEAITQAINHIGSGSIIYFPKGEYLVTSKLPAHRYQAFIGEGPANFVDLYYAVNEIEYANLGERLYWIYVKYDVDIDNDFKKYIKGDQVFLHGFKNTYTNKGHELVKVDYENRRFLIKHTYYDGDEYNEVGVDATANLPFTLGGSCIRHRSLDGRIIEGEWFINEEGLNYFSFQNIAFVGAGVSSSSGSGIKITRGDRALEGIYLHNVSFIDIPDTALTIEAPINSVFENIRAKKIAFDFINIISKNG
jgi:hypothetical protein